MTSQNRQKDQEHNPWQWILAAKGSLKADINVTPLVDVMLVLLIIMMLIAPMLQKGVNVKLPEAGNTVDKPDTQDQTVVAIDSAEPVLGQRHPGRQGRASPTRCKSVLEDKTEKVVLIKGDQDALYSAIMQAMDDLRKAQIEDIGLITEQEGSRNRAVGGK